MIFLSHPKSHLSNRPHTLKSFSWLFFVPFSQKNKITMLSLFFRAKTWKHGKTPPHPKIRFLCYIWYFLFFLGKKHNYPALMGFLCFFCQKKSFAKTPTHPKIVFFSSIFFVFFGKKTKLRCSHAFLCFFWPKKSLVKTPTHPKICFSRGWKFSPSKIHCYIGLFS